jgi:N-acetylglucosaminyl-diphospho-decaprenol L-rhamnosyltransferase
LVYFVTVNYYSTELIGALLSSAKLQTARSAYRFVVVNNSPNDGTVRSFASDTVRIIEAGKNIGFGAGCNLALTHIYQTEPDALVWLINPDATLPPLALERLLQLVQTHPMLSLIGTIVYEPDGTIWFAGGEFEPKTGKILPRDRLPTSDLADYFETDWLTGCSLIINLKLFTTCPLFDPDFFLYYEDFDFCRRYANQGHTLAIAPAISVIHQPSSISDRNLDLKVQHSTYGYLLALARHSPPYVVPYRLGRMLAHAIRNSFSNPKKAISIIKGILSYLNPVRTFGNAIRKFGD